MDSSVFIDQCPACKRTLKIDTAVSGPLSRCPACGAVLKVMVPKQPKGRRGRRRDEVSEEAMGVLALWICGVGAVVAIGSIIGVIAVGMNKKAATTAAPPVVQRFVPPPTAPASMPAPSARLADANDAAPSPWPVFTETPGKSATTPTAPEKVAGVPPAEPAKKTPPAERAPATRPVEPAPPQQQQQPPPQQTTPPAPETIEPTPTDLLARLAGVRADVFSHREDGGPEPVFWRPAPLAHHYVFFTLAVRNPTPQPTQLFFDARSSSRAVKLTNASGESATMLGRMNLTAAPARQFDIRPLNLAGREEVSDLVIAFVVPTHWREATLDGPGFTTGRIRLPAPDEEPVSPDDLIGWWRRTPGQPVRVRYVNPVLSALADPSVERLLITTDGRPGQAIVSIPFVDVAGTIAWPSDAARSLSGTVDLRRGGARLEGSVRFTDGGKVVILYASDDPFEQVIYQKKSI